MPTRPSGTARKGQASPLGDLLLLSQASYRQLGRIPQPLAGQSSGGLADSNSGSGQETGAGAILAKGLEPPAASAAALQKDQTGLGTARTVVGAPATVETALSLSQQVNAYLRAGFMASMATESNPWQVKLDAAPLTQAAPRPVQHISNFGNGLAILAGAFGTGIGIAEIEHGQKAQGAKDLTVAGLTSLSGVANLSAKVSKVVGAGFEAIGAKGIAAPGEVGVGAGTPIAGLACILGGSFQLVDSLRKHDVEHAVEGGAQIAGGSMLTASAFLDGTLIGAPAGVVLGAVGGLMLFTQAVVANRQALIHGAERIDKKITGFAHRIQRSL